MPARPLRNRKLTLLAALTALALAMMVTAQSATAAADDEYCGISGCPSGGGQNDGGGSPSGPGSGSGRGSNGGGSGDGAANPSGGGAGSGGGTSLGPDASVTGASGADAGGPATDGASQATSSTSGGSESAGGGAADKKRSGSVGAPDGRSLGELLSNSTEPIASTPASAARRTAKTAGEDGGSGLIWLLVALGAITAVAAGGVAVRRRQAR